MGQAWRASDLVRGLSDDERLELAQACVTQPHHQEYVDQIFDAIRREEDLREKVEEHKAKLGRKGRRVVRK